MKLLIISSSWFIWVKELEAATETANIVHIEHDLKVAENRLNFELFKIEHPNDLKGNLLQRAKSLVKLTEDAIAKLKAAKNDAEATILQNEETSVKNFVKELEAAKTDAEVAHIEFALYVVELRLSGVIRKVNKPDQNPDDLLKDNLLKRATTVEKQAEALIKKLKAEKKDSDVEIIQKDEALVKKLVSDLEAAKQGSVLSHIEQQLQTAENRLVAEIRRLNSHGTDPQPNDKVKEQLLNLATALEKQAEEAIKKLKDDGKDSEVAIVQKEEAQIKKLVHDLQAAKTDAEIKKLEQALTAAGTKLAIELKKIQPSTASHSLTRRDAKQDLIVKATDLLKKAEEAIKKLENEHKTTEIAAIKKEETDIQKLIKELQAASDATKITHIEHDLTIADSRLAYELRKIKQPAPHHADQKEILLNKATILEKQAETLVMKLKTEKREADAAILEKEEALVKKLVKDLQAAKTPAEIAHIEHELQAAEYKLSYQVRKILDHDFTEESRKKALLQRADYLEKYTLAAIKRLKEDKKDADAATLEKEEIGVKNLIKNLDAAKTEAEIHKIENDLLAAEDKLLADLKKFVTQIQAQDNALKQQLIQKATVLEKQAEEAIKKLKAVKKDVEAAVIEKDETLIKKLVTDLQAAKSDADVKKIEQELEAAETRLVAEIKKVTP